MKVMTPAKLILSGEHAAVYGHPVLAMAVNRYMELEMTSQSLPIISFASAALKGQYNLSFPALNALRSRIKKYYTLFQEGYGSIKNILTHPMELVQFALSILLETYQGDISMGMKIRMQSTVPMGCGMGSSAVTTLSMIVAAAHYLQYKMTEEDYYRLALHAENMQHGQSSGIDIQTALYGGCIYRHTNMIKRALPKVPMYLVNTGTPQSSTGECVSKAASYFKTSSIGNDFAAVTCALDDALQQNLISSCQQAIRANHQLLNTIGVVPDKVGSFIREIEHFNGAAKICGAGTIIGEEAGMVLVMIEDALLLRNSASRYGYTVSPIECVSRGAYVI